jgi:leucyl aminopeptidase
MLAYAVQGGATNIVDLATLTGAIVVALGNEAAGLIGKPDSWTAQVAEAADEAIERVWRLPLYPEYRQRIDSYLADMKNTSGSPGGALTASALLSEFVDDVPWAHLDIAGTAWHDTKLAFAPVGGTGWGVATLVRLASNLT